MTEHAKQVLESVATLTQKLGRPPLIIEVHRDTGLPATTVHNSVVALRKAGLLRRRRKWSRGLTLAQRCPACGSPVSAS